MEGKLKPVEITIMARSRERGELGGVRTAEGKVEVRNSTVKLMWVGGGWWVSIRQADEVHHF